MTKYGVLRGALLSVVLAALAPAVTYAQGGAASITGVVKDASGAVLPGVTVEASSPVLIEKVRTVVSAGNGQYRIVDLRPGVYTVTFSLPGFSTFKREGIELTGTFTATIDAEMNVGAQEETITVTGQAPIVDVQGVSRQQVLSKEIVDTIPTGMYSSNLAVLIPGVSLACSGAGCSGSAQDVGGAGGDSRSQLVIHGSKFRDQRMFMNGMSMNGATGGVLRDGPNVVEMDEIQIDTAAVNAMMPTGGVQMNLVPKEGGNHISGGLFLSGTNSHFQAKNIDQDLIDRGYSGSGSTKRNFTIGPTFGGPIVQDKLWFFLSAIFLRPTNNVANKFANLNGTATQFTYAPDFTKPGTEGSKQNSAGVHLTWQASPKNKIGASFDIHDLCICPNLRSGTSAPEAVQNVGYLPDNWIFATWSSPLTNHLLLEAGVGKMISGLARRPSPYIRYDLTQVVESAPPPSYLGITTYRGANPGTDIKDPWLNTSFTATYVTGGHAFKTGITTGRGFTQARFRSPKVIQSYNFTRQVPTAFVVDSQPYDKQTNTKMDLGVYVQDKWTYKRLTLSGGLRFDYVNKFAPQHSLGPAPLFPTRNITFPETTIASLKDIDPRMGAAIDLFGNGKTALKGTLNRYVEDASLGGGSDVFIGSPIDLYQFTASRSWVDNGNFYPDCDFTNPNLQDNTATGGDRCGAFTGNNVNFGSARPGTTVDPGVPFGWGARGYNWEYSATIQQQLTRNLGLDVGYFHRAYGNFTITDNLAVSASDYSPFSVTVPTDPRLPLSGQTITGFLNINPNVASIATNNIIKHAASGQQYDIWKGVDVSANSRFQGLTLQGGVSTGRTVRDNCAVLASTPESGITSQQSGNADAALLTVAGPLANPFCHQDSGYQTQAKLVSSYTIPKVDILLSGAFQSNPGPQIVSTLSVPSATVQTAGGLGRPLSGNAANVTVNIVRPGSLYGDRINQTDLRIGKVFRFGGTRKATASVDLFNAFNANPVLTEVTAYTSFRQPNDVLQARLIKFTLVMAF